MVTQLLILSYLCLIGHQVFMSDECVNVYIGNLEVPLSDFYIDGSDTVNTFEALYFC